MMKLILVLATLTLAGQVQAADPFKPEDLFELEWVEDPQISPDGSRIVYTRTGFDVMRDREVKQLWIIDSDGENHQPLGDAGISSSLGRWAPEGRRLAYLADSSGSLQIHVLWVNTGRDSAITNLAYSPGSLEWSPDGKRLAFVQFTPTEGKPIATLPKPPVGAKWSKEPDVFEDVLYRTDSSGFLKSGRPQVYMVSASGGAPIQLTDGNYVHGGELSWSANSNAIYYSSNYNQDWQVDRWESDIFKVDVSSREVVRVTSRDGKDASPSASPDGNWLAYLGYDDIGGYRDDRLYLSSTEDHEPRLLVDLDRPIKGFHWSSNSRSVYFSYLDQSVMRVARVDLRGRVESLFSGLGGTSIGRPYSSGKFSVSDNGTLAYELNSLPGPSSLGVLTGRHQGQLTYLNRDLMDYRQFAMPEDILIESSHDQLPVQGWILKPPGFDPAQKYPLILEIHGGPHTAYGAYFSAELQLYAAAGYVVLYLNPRGSVSYGESFAREIYLDYPGHDFDDLMSAVDAVISQGYVDEENLFVTGGSGGGLLTAWIVTKTDRFKAAVSQKPVINWITHTLTADIGSFFWSGYFSGLPWIQPEKYIEKSPVSFAGNVNTPTMLLTGEQDWRTPMSESEQFYQALRIRGVDSALVRIKGAGHSISERPANLLRKVSFVLGWFDRYRTKEKSSR